MYTKLLIIFIQIILIFLLIAIITFFIRLNEAIKLEKRISKYSVRYEGKSENLSLFDKCRSKYLRFVKKQRKKMRKLFPRLIRKYYKYVTSENVKAEDYITYKLTLTIVFVLLTLIAEAIQGRFITAIQLFISMIIGFFALDVILLISYRVNRKHIEDDMLRAVIVMNNAFKSGKSTIQAVEIASKELPKPINFEFKKICDEMKYGLSVDTVFDRFAKRIKIEEAEYLSSSLTILNKTGGNIVAVFNAIEKTLFDKKKLKEELRNSTMVSKLVVKILLVVPILFVAIIYLLDPSYFDAFFESTLGYIMVGIIIIMFIIYAYLLDRIVKVNY